MLKFLDNILDHRLPPLNIATFRGSALPLIPNYVVYWTFEPHQGVLASRESLFAALRGGRCSSAPEPSWIDQTASAPTSGALLMFPFLAERPPSAVGIKGPMNFWVWYEPTGRQSWKKTPA
jgi:hypothetical protein